MTDDDLLEALAALEHEQWMHWSQNIAEREDLPDDVVERWGDYWTAYENLDDDVQEHDRTWARKVLDVLDAHDEP